MTPATPAQPTVVTLPDEIDMINGGAISKQLAGAFDRGAKVVIADMTATTFCDTLGAHMLVLA
jgi:anti-anti-sigma regulatory factor